MRYLGSYRAQGHRLWVFLAVFLIAFSSAASAVSAVHFSDVPPDCWAANAVYTLANKGIIDGYPDGTFRGHTFISRYESAALLSRFINYFNLKAGIEEKLLEELKTEVALRTYKQDKEEKENQIFGYLASHGRYSFSPLSGTKLDYRLKVNWLKEFSPDSSVKICLDTVDAGFNTTVTRDLVTRLLDVEGRFKLGPVDYKVNIGPGVVVHNETDGLFPSYNNTIYIRPKTAIVASTSLSGVNLSAEYVTRQVQPSGLVGVNELTGKLTYDFGKVGFHVRPRYLFVIDGNRDILAEGGVDIRPNKYWETNLFLSVGNFSKSTSGMYAKVIQKLKDPWETGTDIVLRFDKVGSGYRMDDLDKYEFVYLNNFSRLILDGTVDVGLKIKQQLPKNFSLEWKGDYVTTGAYQYGVGYPGTYFLWQLGLDYAFSSAIAMNTFYRVYEVPSGMAQFSDPVPTSSQMLGVGMTCSF
ncbi:MAG: S-layer homology domain-containing protein [Candidatus Saganbacteria bacterium]|nr:S-layer homology domain-containing protein [Candidatus Saganbacteria bacterium]